MAKIKSGYALSRAITHSILDERLDRDALSQILKSPVIDWMTFAVFAGQTCITTQVWARLSQIGMTALMPDDVRQGFALVHSANADRNRYIRSKVRELGLLLNSAGISPIPLKGVALLLYGTYDEPGDRIMSDMDILIRLEQIPAALEVLARHNYLQRCNVFAPKALASATEFARIDCSDFRNAPDRPGHHLSGIKPTADDHVLFELHRRVVKDTHDAGGRLNASALVNLHSVTIDGVQYEMLSKEFVFLHTLHHAYASGDTLDLGLTDYRHLIDADRLLKAIASDGDFSTLLSLVSEIGFEDKLTFFLWQAEEVLGTNSMPHWKPSANGLALIKKFKHVRRSHKAYLMRKWWIGFNKRRVRYLNASFLRQTYGELPFYRTIPLYSRYLLGKLLLQTRKLAEKANH